MNQSQQLTLEQRLDKLEKALEWLQADVAIQINLSREVLQALGLIDRVQATLDRYQKSLLHRDAGFGPDEDTHPGG